MSMVTRSKPRKEEDAHVNEDEEQVDEGKDQPCTIIHLVTIERIFGVINLAIDTHQHLLDPVRRESGAFREREANRIAGCVLQ